MWFWIFRGIGAGEDGKSDGAAHGGQWPANRYPVNVVAGSTPASGVAQVVVSSGIYDPPFG